MERKRGPNNNLIEEPPAKYPRIQDWDPEPVAPMLWTREPTNLLELYHSFQELQRNYVNNEIAMRQRYNSENPRLNKAYVWENTYFPLLSSYLENNHPEMIPILPRNDRLDFAEAVAFKSMAEKFLNPDEDWNPDYAEFEKLYVKDTLGLNETIRLSPKMNDEFDDSVFGKERLEANADHELVFFDSEYPMLKPSQLNANQMVAIRSLPGTERFFNERRNYEDSVMAKMGNYRQMASKLLGKELSDREFAKYMTVKPQVMPVTNVAREWMGTERADVMEDLYGEERYSSAQTNATHFVNNQGK
jgi:hypothetical protein